MTANVAQITPDQAISAISLTFQAMAELQASDPSATLQSILVEGDPGVGKTSIARAVAKSLGAKFVDIRPNQQSPEVVAGIHTMNYETGRMMWMPPEWLPSPDGSDGPILLFFDELSAADDRIRKPLFSAFLEREMNGKKFPNNVYIMAAGNEAEGGTTVFAFDNATRTRFITYRIIADLTSWIEKFAPANNVTPTVITVLKGNIDTFCETARAFEEGQEAYGNPRNWHFCSNLERAIMKSPSDRQDPDKRAALLYAVSGRVGTSLGDLYMAAFDEITQMSNLYDLLRANPQERSRMWPKTLGQMYALTYSMMAYPNDLESAREVVDLAAEFPEDYDIPLIDCREPLLLTVQHRLAGLGIKQNAIDKLFAAENSEAADSVLANGPLFRCS